MGREIPFKGNGKDTKEELLRGLIEATKEPPPSKVEVKADRGGIAVNGNNNLVVKFGNEPIYESLKNAVDSELQAVEEIWKKASSLKQEIGWIQKGILIGFGIYAAVLWLFQELIHLFPGLYHYSPEVAFIPLGILLLLGFQRASQEKSYFKFLEASLPLLRKKEKRLLKLYNEVCKHFANTHLFQKLQTGLDRISALEREYEALSKTGVAKKSYPWF